MELPKFDSNTGFIYPLCARLLEYCTRCTIARRFKLSPKSTDFYLLGCMALTAGLAVASITEVGSLRLLGIAGVLGSWRFFELFSINIFEFCVGAYRPESHAPLNRVVILKLFNLVEIFILFAIVYYLPGKYGNHWMNQPFSSFLDAFYFSIISALTVGYGDYYPTHWFLKWAVIVEVLFFVLIALSLLGIIRSRAPLLPRDTVG